MATDIRRSRSNTSMSTRSNRPLSRASTTSVHSFEQFQPQQQQPRPSQFSQQPQYNTAFTSEPLQPALLQAAQHVSAQDTLGSMSLESVQQYLGYPAESTPQPSQLNGMSQQHMDAHSFHGSMPPQPQPHFMAAPLEGEERKKKGSTSGSATNDKELRQLLAQNENRNLKDVAAEVIQNDRTSKAEKSKQLFAMLWWVPNNHTIYTRTNNLQAEICLPYRQNFCATQSCLFQVRGTLRHGSSYPFEPCIFRQTCARHLSRYPDPTPWCSWRVQVPLR